MRIKSLAFWNEFYSAYPNERIYNWMQEIAEGADWFRNLSLVNIAIADTCGMGRIGFDQSKFEDGQKFVKRLLNKHELTGLMQS